MSDYKICPLGIEKKYTEIGEYEDEKKCIGSRCAWYDQTAERCAVLSLARNK